MSVDVGFHQFECIANVLVLGTELGKQEQLLGVVLIHVPLELLLHCPLPKLNLWTVFSTPHHNVGGVLRTGRGVRRTVFSALLLHRGIPFLGHPVLVEDG